MHGDYVGQTIIQDNYFYYFDANTYDEDYDFTIDSCVIHTDTLHAHKNNIIPSKRVQIS